MCLRCNFFHLDDTGFCKSLLPTRAVVLNLKKYKQRLEKKSYKNKRITIVKWTHTHKTVKEHIFSPWATGPAKGLLQCAFLPGSQPPSVIPLLQHGVKRNKKFCQKCSSSSGEAYDLDSWDLQWFWYPLGRGKTFFMYGARTTSFKLKADVAKKQLFGSFYAKQCSTQQ